MHAPRADTAMWVRHDGDRGYWCPGLYVDAREVGSMLLSAVRGDSSRSTVAANAQKVLLFWLPYNERLVAATDWRTYEDKEGTAVHKPFPVQHDAMARMEAVMRREAHRKLLASALPAAPSACIFGSPVSTATTSAARSSFGSGDWSASSTGNTPQDSPASSTLSMGTEIDLLVTQQEQCLTGPLADPRRARAKGRECVDFFVDASIQNTHEEGRETDENVEGANDVPSRDAPRNGGRKRDRHLASSENLIPDEGGPDTLAKIQDARGHAVTASVLAEVGGPRRKKTCFGAPIGSDRDTNNKSNASARANVCSGRNCDRASDKLLLRESSTHPPPASTADAGNAERPPEGPPSNHSNIHESAGGVIADREDIGHDDGGATQRRPSGERPAPVSRERTRPFSNAASAVMRDGSKANPQQMHQNLPCRERARASRQAREDTLDDLLTNAAPGDEANLEEAAMLRAAGVTGEESFHEMIGILRRLGWTWTNSLVHKLGSETWILKPGHRVSSAERGLGKFGTKTEVVDYVRKVLQIDEHVDGSNDGTSTTLPSDEDVRDHAVTSSAPSNDLPKAARPSSPELEVLQSALEALQPSNAPAVLEQRRQEFDTILRFVESSVTDGRGGSIYLCGCPGTGKTQTMTRVQDNIQRMGSKGAFPSPKFHSFTGTAFTGTNTVHDALWRAVAGDGTAPTNVREALRKKLTRFHRPTMRSPMLVVVLDEIDQLLSQNGQMLRDLFEWADAPKSRLILVGIANSIDFDVGFSDLDKTPVKVLFPAYTPSQLADILTFRAGIAVQKPAIQLCSKKIGAIHGDARRAISLCREAVIVAKEELQAKLESALPTEDQERSTGTAAPPLVTIRHMSMALAAGRVSPCRDAIAALSSEAQMVLCVAASALTKQAESADERSDMTKAATRGQLTQGELHEKCSGVWRKLRKIDSASQIEFSGTVDMLVAQGLLGFKGKQGARNRARKLFLQIDFADVEVALGRQPFFRIATGV